MPKPNSIIGWPCDQPGTLIKTVLDLIKKDNRTVDALCRDLNLPRSWFVQFKLGTITKPSVNRVQYLYEKLSGKKL